MGAAVLLVWVDPASVLARYSERIRTSLHWFNPTTPNRVCHKVTTYPNNQNGVIRCYAGRHGRGRFAETRNAAAWAGRARQARCRQAADSDSKLRNFRNAAASTTCNIVTDYSGASYVLTYFTRMKSTHDCPVSYNVMNV